MQWPSMGKKNRFNKDLVEENAKNLKTFSKWLSIVIKVSPKLQTAVAIKVQSELKYSSFQDHSWALSCLYEKNMLTFILKISKLFKVPFKNGQLPCTHLCTQICTSSSRNTHFNILRSSRLQRISKEMQGWQCNDRHHVVKKKHMAYVATHIAV